MKTRTNTVLIAALLFSPLAPAADGDCVAANAAGKKIYTLAYTMSQASRDEQALTATQGFWAVHEQFGMCADIAKIAAALRHTGFGPEKKPPTAPLTISGGQAGATGKYDRPGLPVSAVAPDRRVFRK